MDLGTTFPTRVHELPAKTEISRASAQSNQSSHEILGYQGSKASSGGQQVLSLRKHAYSNTLNILPPKDRNFQIKKSYFCHISAQNTDRGHSLEPSRRGGSNEYPQSMFLSRYKNK